MVSLFRSITNCLHASHHCPFCQLPAPTRDQFWCDHCLAHIAQRPYCHHCGHSQLTNTPHCGHCLRSPPPWQRLVRVGEFRFPLRQWVHQFKFQRHFWLADPLAALLALHIPHPAPVLLPVPLHPLRRLTRGFNQSTLLADALARRLGSQCWPHALRRTQHTVRQHTLPRAARQRNLQQAFAVRDIALPDHVALVDDVLTTGSTVTALTHVLHQHGVKTVDVYCLGFTPIDKNHKNVG
ncbi:ComF family protein [Photobacterium aphoticum]|uniref:ComF family protein n=2 Tax=Photobacterium aphoticum TaxID=754436 RepID=UPI0009E59167|nr:ComF family protein [Photobacterium aphoticum]